MKQYKYVTWIPAAIVMCIIFAFSAKTAAESSETSSGIVRSMIHMWEKVFSVEWETEKEREETLGKLEHLVRKTAHGCEYAVLAICVAFHLLSYQIKNKKRAMIAILVCIFYAATDEIHQLYVPGRSGQLSDVMIDSIGAAIGTGLFMISLSLISSDKY